MKKRRGRPFTKEETQYIEDNKDKLTYKEIAKAIGRRQKSIKQKIYMMSYRKKNIRE